MSVRERLDSDHTPSSRGIWDTFADSLCAHQNTKIHLGSEQLRALTLSDPDSKNPLPPRSDALGPFIRAPLRVSIANFKTTGSRHQRAGKNEEF